MAYVLAGLIGLAALTVALLVAMRRLKVSEATIEKARGRQAAQVERIKKAARTNLNLRRECAALRRRKTAADIACEELEQRLSSSKAHQSRTYVLDERRTQADQPYMAKIGNADYERKVNPKLERLALESWRRGRRFLVWAPDEQKARDRIAARLPEAKGFDLIEIVKQDT